MKLCTIISVVCFDFLFLSLLFVQGQEPAKKKYPKVETRKPSGKEKHDPRKLVEDSKVGIAMLDQEAAKGVLSAKSNGVELAIKLKAVPNKKFTDIEVAWTITYSGPRPPLIIVQPSLKLTTMATTITIYAAAKGKDYALPFLVSSPWEDSSLTEDFDYVIDAYGEKKPLPKRPPIHSLLDPDRFKIRTRTKEWFITVPAGKSAQGVLTVSGEKLQEFARKYYPGEFDWKHSPRLFVQVSHSPWDRGVDFNFDAWVGEFLISYNAVPDLPK